MKRFSLRLFLATLALSTLGLAVFTSSGDGSQTPDTSRPGLVVSPAPATTAPTQDTTPVAHADHEAALPALPTRDLTIGVRRIYAFENHRTLTMSTGGSNAKSNEGRYGLTGHLSFTVANLDDELVHLVARFEGAQTLGLAESGEARQALATPFVVSLEKSGRIAALHFDKATPAATANLLTSAVASLQFVAPDDAEAARWESLEDDAAGEYRAAYSRKAGSPSSVEKNRLAYIRLVTMEGLRPSGEVADYDVRSNERFELGADGWPERLESTERVSASTPGEAAIEVESQATTTATLLATERVDIDHAAFERSWDGLVTRETARATSFADVRHKIDRDRVAGADFRTLHGELGRALADHGLRSKAYPAVAARLGSLLRTIPEVATEVAAAARSAGTLDEAAALTAALGDAGTKEARAELANLLTDSELEAERRAAAAIYLGNAREVDAASLDTLVSTATNPDADTDPTVREAALLGAGSAVNRANAQGDVATGDAVDTLIKGLQQAQTPAERVVYLDALGNSGDVRALPAIQSMLGAAEVEVVATAVMALRLMPSPVDPILGLMLSHPHPMVRGAAITAMGHRPVLPFVETLLSRLSLEPETELRVAIVRLLKELVPTEPELGDALAALAAKDPAQSVREAITASAE